MLRQHQFTSRHLRTKLLHLTLLMGQRHTLRTLNHRNLIRRRFRFKRHRQFNRMIGHTLLRHRRHIFSITMANRRSRFRVQHTSTRLLSRIIATRTQRQIINGRRIQRGQTRLLRYVLDQVTSHRLRVFTLGMNLSIFNRRFIVLRRRCTTLRVPLPLPL